MSIISDVKANFADASESPSYYVVTVFDDVPNSDNTIKIYAVIDDGYNQDNVVADKPLEQGQFTTDSVQIKPYMITLRGVFLPLDESSIVSYQDLNNFISNEFERLRNFTNGVQLFTIYNDFSFGLFQPVKLKGISKITTPTLTVPEVIMRFQQVQSSTAVIYSTAQVSPNQAEPQNQPRS